MRLRAFDIEADSLYDTVSTVWVLSWKDLEDKEVHSIPFPTDHDIREFFNQDDIYIGHNIIDYDLPVLEKIYGVNLDIHIIDTYVLSRIINPDRHGGHSLDALSGGSKGNHSDFSRFSQEMLEYCEQDVRITADVCKKLLRSLQIGVGSSAINDPTSPSWLPYRYRSGNPSLLRLAEKNERIGRDCEAASRYGHGDAIQCSSQ